MDLVAERHQIVRDIEDKLARLEVINSLLDHEIEVKPNAQSSSTRDAILAAVADGQTQVREIAAHASREVGATISVEMARNHLRALRSKRAIICANARYYVPDGVRSAEVLISAKRADDSGR